MCLALPTSYLKSLTEPGPIDRGPPAHGGAGEVNPEQGTLRHPAPSSNDATSPELPVPGKPGGGVSLGKVAPETPPQAMQLLACTSFDAPRSCNIPGALPSLGPGSVQEPSLEVRVGFKEEAILPLTMP